MVTFVRSYGKKYIFVVVDYVSKFVKAVALPENDGKKCFWVFEEEHFLKVWHTQSYYQ